MGLDVVVGIFSAMENYKVEGPRYRRMFKNANRALVSAGLPMHDEPGRGGKTIGFQMYGYSGLHYLRRIAAHISADRRLPPPGGEDCDEDPLLKKYYDDWGKRYRSRESPDRRRGKHAPQFDHLIAHADSEGFYIPVDFEEVIVYEREPGAFDQLGSSIRLLRELERLARALRLPLSLDPDSDRIWFAPESQGNGVTKWERYGVESFTCLRLYLACKASIRLRSAIAFC